MVFKTLKLSEYIADFFGKIFMPKSLCQFRYKYSLHFKELILVHLRSILSFPSFWNKMSNFIDFHMVHIWFSPSYFEDSAWVERNIDWLWASTGVESIQWDSGQRSHAFEVDGAKAPAFSHFKAFTKLQLPFW